MELMFKFCFHNKKKMYPMWPLDIMMYNIKSNLQNSLCVMTPCVQFLGIFLDTG